LRTPSKGFSLGDLTRILPSHPELVVKERQTTLEDIYLDLVEEEAA
jgi:hypothetical protein